MAGQEGGPRGIAPRELRVLLPGEQATERRITPELLLLDNRSEDSARLRSYWNIQRADGELTLEWDCDDARQRPPLRAAQLRSISTGANEESYESYGGIFNDKGIKRIAVVAHFDGDTERKGHSPEGCGGLEAKRKQKANEAPREGGVFNYVRESIAHEDPIMQAIISADQISRYTDKPILAAACNHLTGEIFPVALFQQRGNGPQLILSSVRIGDIIDGRYKPEEIYAKGLPRLDRNDPLLRDFYTYFAENGDQMRKLNDKYPNLRDRMKVQNPDAIVISSQTRPLRTRYYDTFGDPGVAFEITIARCRKTLEASARITTKAIREALEQAHYAMTHAMDNRGKDNLPFRDTRTVLIETVHMEESRKIAESLAATEFGARWLSEGNAVIIAEVRSGEIVDNKIEYFKPTS